MGCLLGGHWAVGWLLGGYRQAMGWFLGGHWQAVAWLLALLSAGYWMVDWDG